MVRARFSPWKPGTSRLTSSGRTEDSEGNDDAGYEGQQSEYGFGEFAGLALAAFGTEAGIDRNERCGEDAFAEQILQHVGNAEGGAIGVGGQRGSEIVGEEALADESAEAAEQNSGGDHGGCSFASAGFGTCVGRRFNHGFEVELELILHAQVGHWRGIANAGSARWAVVQQDSVQ